MKILYTAIFGDYDKLVNVQPQEGWKYICFTDQPLKSDVWEIIQIKSEDKIYRKIKLLPHVYLPEHEVSIWVDGNINLKKHLNLFIQDKTFCVMDHPHRKDIFQEADACIKLGKDGAGTIQKQIATYLNDGYNQPGLIGSGVIVRRDSPTNRFFNEAWWGEVKRHSKRDQLSFNYLVWKLKFEYQTFPFLENCEYVFHNHRLAAAKK